MMAVIAQIILDPVRKQQTRVWRHVILHINGLPDTTLMASACFKKEKKIYSHVMMMGFRVPLKRMCASF